MAQSDALKFIVGDLADRGVVKTGEQGPAGPAGPEGSSVSPQTTPDTGIPDIPPEPTSPSGPSTDQAPTDETPINLFGPTSPYSFYAPTKYHGWAVFDKVTGKPVQLTQADIDTLNGALTGVGDGGSTGTQSSPSELQNAATAAGHLAETQRVNRMREVQNAQDAIQARIQQAQQARLEGAKFAITPDMAASGYFPGLGPNSPLVHAGLAEPFQFRRVPFNPERGVNLDPQQIASDLARLRGIAGY